MTMKLVTKMLDKQFLIGSEVLSKIEQQGHQAYFVGGCVRDLLLGHQIQDIDIATSAFPDTILNLFEKVIPLGVEHGTVIVRHEKISFEVTTFRLDGTYSDQRHPDEVEFIDNIELDLKRRDFTINALAMNKEGKIIDLFNGQDDLNNQLIRTVGNGVERFKEDPLRIIRAIRFSSQLGFTIEHNTLEAIDKVKHELKKIAVERITSEMNKLVVGYDINKGLSYLQETGIYKYLPIMKDYPSLIKKIPYRLEPMETFGEFIALCHFINPTIQINTWTKQWKCSNKVKNIADNLANALFYYNEIQYLDSWLVYKLNFDLYPAFLRLAKIVFENNPLLNKENLLQLSNKLPIQSTRELDINGNDIIEMFPQLSKGPWIQQTIKQLELKVVCGHLDNNHEKLKEWIKWNPPEIN